MHYPVFLDLRGRPCTVVGGGHLAEEKVRGLLAVEAMVTVIAPALTPALTALVEAGRLLHRPRGYHPGDLDGACLVISCEQTPDMAEAVWQEALHRNILINTLDDVPRCQFIAPSIVRRGDLAIAISTGGKAPVLAVRLRQWLEAQLGEEYGRFLSLAGSVRAALARRWPDFATRRELWYRLVDSDVLDLLRQGDETAAVGRFRDILGVEPERAVEEEAA
ncbi:MAG TPA: bifunctional precorrin-2 dehydrogenase/sirohydrochlorin ferrochelatase [Thermoanaerobaculia bacterium]|nr:bifunctional precorrin-2 dehydrogenase/sirohydrochlorin ferrochelatase [Thermoanaerobaculia bacterium]